MIVDNSSHFRKGLAAVLKSIDPGLMIDEAASGSEFLEKISHSVPDLVFMDVRMPEMDGIETTRLARMHCPDTTIIGFSSYENETYIRMMLKAGANGYLFKSDDNYDFLCEIISHPETKEYTGNMNRENQKFNSNNNAV